MNDSSATIDQKKGFLDKLNQYKDFIIILVFFLGGFFWMFEYFATKKQVTHLSDVMEQNVLATEKQVTHLATKKQVTHLRCLLDENVQVVRAKMEYQFSHGLLEGNRVKLRKTRFKIKKAEGNSEETSALEYQVDRIKEQGSDLKTNRDKFKVEMDDALKSLIKNGCSKLLQS